MSTTRLDMLERKPYADGRSFGSVGPYERIDAIAHYAVDPMHTANEGIVDLALAERGADGLVSYSGDMTLLKPVDPAGSNRALLMQVPNRGSRSLVRLNLAQIDTVPTAEVASGDGFLFKNGWAIAWAGWQWDVPRTPERTRIGLVAPSVPLAARKPASQMQLRIQPNSAQRCFALTDQHVGDMGNHQLVRALDVNDPAAKLLVRASQYESPIVIPRTKWRFAKDVDGSPVEDCGHVWLEAGFEPGLIYDVVYTPFDCPVVGAGLLATRNLASFLRYNEASPLANSIDYVIGEGQSQCGRFLRTYLHLGLNNDEAGQPVFDGVLAHVAGGRRGEFNHRYAQPSVQPTPSFGHLFPFADEPQTDRYTGKTAGLLDTQRARGGLPKIFLTDTSSEYWRGDANLSHTDLGTNDDAVLPDNLRRYLFASAQHAPGGVPLARRTGFGSIGANYMNIIDYRPLYRAALTNLLAWIADGVEPPGSSYPCALDNTRRTRVELIEQLSRIPGLTTPNAELLTTMYSLELGPHAADGIGELPAKISSKAYPDWVSDVDVDGNEISGIPMPDVSVPVATHLGFNPRHPDSGGAGQLLEYIGTTVPFLHDSKERQAANDPRLSLAERYSSREDYLRQVREAAERLVRKRYLLARDVDLCIALAAERYDACVSTPRSK